MTTIINANTSSGLVYTADTSGIVKVQSNGVTTNALAWVNFTGSTGAIKSAYNFSSVTRTATGQWTATFATALSDANYTVVASANQGTSAGVSTFYQTQTTASFQLQNYVGGAAYDPPSVSITVFGN